ncbi:pyruvate formate lyase-activating protein [bacterium]|nr:pyruvate formate lyase-activating protein [bacterium]MCP5463006.1 pyruvate formate lyase-activating protein [bacterium]
MAAVARIHSIETFGTVDGPGIRYVIFFQGCLLKCIYCHNRDTWDSQAGREVTVDGLFQEIKSYMPYFAASNGGVTATGGEPTIHAVFLTELFKKCKEHSIHTALDTSGFASIDDPAIRELLDCTDLILLDIKSMNDAVFKRITGASNQKTLAMARYLCEINKPTWIRYVILPGYTDDTASARQLADFIGDMPNVEKVELLPYHSMGEFKWQLVGDTYVLHGVETPSADVMKKIRRIFEKRNIPTY